MINMKWNANGLVQDWTRDTDFISYDENRYAKHFLLNLFFSTIAFIISAFNLVLNNNHIDWRLSSKKSK